MQITEQTNTEPHQELGFGKDNSVNDARWMFAFVVLLAVSVFGLGMVAELLIATPNL